ncbi:MAG: hypothetical protein JWM22_837, partial [Frankiales bacterium]|nr:hypothetical protein [Frankiales bacterium]
MSSRTRANQLLACSGALALGLTALAVGPGAGVGLAAPKADTSTPIKHLVVIFQENVS